MHSGLTGAAFETGYCAACLPACLPCAEAPAPPPTSSAASTRLPPRRRQRQLTAVAMPQLLRPTSLPSMPRHSRFCCLHLFQPRTQMPQLIPQQQRRQQVAQQLSGTAAATAAQPTRESAGARGAAPGWQRPGRGTSTGRWAGQYCCLAVPLASACGTEGTWLKTACTQPACLPACTWPANP